MSAVSVFRHRFFILALGWLGSVILHLLAAAWLVWRSVQVEPEPLPSETDAVQVGLIAPAPQLPPRAQPPARVFQAREAARTLPQALQEAPSSVGAELEPAPPVPADEGSAVPTAMATLDSFSPEALSEELLQQVLTEPADPGEFSITRSPASAYLHYEVGVQRGRERLSGAGNLLWEWQQNRYRIEIVARAFVQISKQVSEGLWQPKRGLLPQMYSDQRGLRSENRVTFERQAEPPQLYFSTSNNRFPLQVGVQDYASLIMQLSSLLASNPSNFYIGTALRFPVADVRKSREMVFRLQEPEMLDTGLGRLQAWRFSYQPEAGSNDRNIDIWFARDADWLPVRLRFADVGRGEVIDFTVRRLERM